MRFSSQSSSWGHPVAICRIFKDIIIYDKHNIMICKMNQIKGNILFLTKQLLKKKSMEFLIKL